MANYVFVMTKMLPFKVCRTSLSLAMAGEPGKRHNVRAHKAQDVFDWLNPLSLGTMSATVYIENVA